MLDGLEASEIKLSELERTRRIDSEFFLKENLVVAATIARLKSMSIAKAASVSDGNHFEISGRFQEKGIPYYRGQDVVSNFFIEQADPICIDQNTFREPHLLRSHLHREDVLLSIVGTIGAVSIVSKDEPATCSCKLAILRPRAINGSLIAAFLLSKYGSNQIKKFVRGALQTGLILEDFDQIHIPILSRNFSTKIQSIVRIAHERSVQATTLYSEAENLLLSKLGFKDWQPSEQNFAVKEFIQSFVSSGRLDAEYYHPEKQQVLDWLSGLRGKTIGEHFTSVYDPLNPVAATPNESVSNYDLNDALPFYLTPKESTPVYELGSTKKRFKKGDVLISRLRSYLKEIAIADLPATENCVGSSEFIILRPKNASITPELLLIYLRSVPVQRIVKWCQSGSNHPRFMEEDLLSIKLPDKLLAAQTRIQQSVRKAISVGRESQRMLDSAKRAVEIAIEHDEAAALKWLKDGSARED